MIFKCAPLLVFLTLTLIAQIFSPLVFYLALAWFVLGATFFIFDKGTPRVPLFDLGTVAAISWCSFFGALLLPLTFSRDED